MRTGAGKDEKASLMKVWVMAGHLAERCGQERIYAGPLVGICWAITGQLGTCFTLGPTSGGTWRQNMTSTKKTPGHMLTSPAQVEKEGEMSTRHSDNSTLLYLCRTLHT